MRRYNNNYRRRYKTKRPVNRVIQAATTAVPPNSNAVGYLFTCLDPCTSTRFALDTGLRPPSSSSINPVAYALVYVPDGYNVNNITYPTVAGTNMYEPSMNVLISGILTDDTTEDHKFCRYSRKMNTGDRIALIYYNSDTTNTVDCSFELNFTTVH